MNTSSTWAQRLRLFAAILAASILVPLLCYVTVVLPDESQHKSFASNEGASYFALAFFVIGGPLTFITVAIFARLMRARIRRNDPGTWKVIMAWALALGGIVLPVIWRLFWGEDSGVYIMALAGALGGLASGAVFCLLTLRRSPQAAAELG